MQCDDVNIELPKVPLDGPLHELNKLKARETFIQEKPFLNMLTINTRYVNNVSIGFRMRPLAPHVRYKPYQIAKRKERYRTMSESNDPEGASASIVKAIVEEEVKKSIEDLNQLKKAKSLESIITENCKSGDGNGVKLGNFPELEVVSNSIQKLRVVE